MNLRMKKMRNNALPACQFTVAGGIPFGDLPAPTTGKTLLFGRGLCHLSHLQQSPSANMWAEMRSIRIAGGKERKPVLHNPRGEAIVVRLSPPE